MDTIFVLNSNKQVIDVLSNNGSNPSAPFFDDIYKAELDTGAETYEFTTLGNPRTCVTLEVGNYVLFKYNGKYKLFQIMETTDEHNEGKKLLTCYCEMAGMELLNDYCEPFSIEGNFITFLNTVLQDTNWQVGLYSASLLDNIQMVSTTEPENVYSLIQNNLATFGGVEVEFRVEFVGNQLVAMLIDCYESGTRGNRTHRRFEYGEDIKGITRNRNIADLATAVIGVGKNGLDFKDIEWDENLGNPCNKPLQQNFVVDIEANDIWNNGGKYIKTVYKSDAETAQDLLQETWDYLQEIKQPKFDYDVDLALVAEDYLDINVGDTNYVLDFDYQPAILLEARVGTLELSFADPRSNKCTLTNYKELTSIFSRPFDLNTVGNMIQSKFPIGGEDIAMGAIGEGHIEVTYYQAIKTDIMNATLANVDTLIADLVDTEQLNAVRADIETLRANDVTITGQLTATNGTITNLNSQVANIQDLIAGNTTTGDLQTIHLTTSNANIDDAVIKNAMIDTVSANKVNTGTLNTNNVNIESEDGGIKISGTTQQFKDKEGHVRVQIGKDASGNFTFCLFSQDGVGILLDETGIKAGAVPDGLIVNDMVASDANISGSKLDISSVITQINNNETTINSSHIKFDDTGQSLLVAFNQLKNTVDTIQEVTIGGDLSSVIEKVNTHTTQIGVMQGQITSLIDNTTITKQDGTVVQLKDEYNSTKDTVNSHTTKIGTLETNYNKVSGDLASVTSKQATLEQTVEGFQQTVSDTYATREELTNTETSVNSNIDSAVDKAKTDTLAEVDDKYTSKTDYEEFKKSTASSFEQTSKDITMKFNDVTEKTTSIGGELKEFKATVSTNIKFSEDGIDIGKNNSPFSVNINNEQMSFRDGGQNVAYISNQEMLITDANINNSLRLGSFVFFPRTNGNTSLVWDDRGNLIQPASSYCNKSNNDYPTHNAYLGSDRPSAGDIVTIEMSGVLASNALYWGVFNSGGYVHVCTLKPWETRKGIIRKSFTWLTNTSDGEHPADSSFIAIYPMPYADGREISTITSVKLYRGDNYWGNSDNIIKYNNLGYNGDRYNYTATQDNDVFREEIYGHFETGKTYKFTCDTDCENWSNDSTIDAVYAMFRRTDNFGETLETVELSSATNTFTVPTAGIWKFSFCLSKNGTTHWFTNAKVVEVVTNGD